MRRVQTLLESVMFAATLVGMTSGGLEDRLGFDWLIPSLSWWLLIRTNPPMNERRDSSGVGVALQNKETSQSLRLLFED